MTTNQESGAAALRRKRNIKYWLLIIVVGTILQAVIILVFVLTFMRIRNPKVRFGSVAVQNLTLQNSSFTMKLNAQVTVKNTNFGQFKFGNSTVTLSYRGNPVGEAAIDKASSGARSTKKMNVTVTVTSSSAKGSRSSDLSGDIKSGKLTLTGHATLNGKIHLFMIFKKKKSAQMNCTMDVNTHSKAVENLHCK